MTEDTGAADTGSDVDPASEANTLLPRLRLIEDQPLDARAAAYTQLHDELQHRLEGGDGSTA